MAQEEKLRPHKFETPPTLDINELVMFAQAFIAAGEPQESGLYRERTESTDMNGELTVRQLTQPQSRLNKLLHGSLPSLVIDRVESIGSIQSVTTINVYKFPGRKKSQARVRTHLLNAEDMNEPPRSRREKRKWNRTVKASKGQVTALTSDLKKFQ